MLSLAEWLYRIGHIPALITTRRKRVGSSSQLYPCHIFGFVTLKEWSRVNPRGSKQNFAF